jgi:hypothetical protein
VLHDQPSRSAHRVVSLVDPRTTRELMTAGTVLLGIMFAGTVNIMLNGLGAVLSPVGNPRFLPGMNAGAFNLGAGLSLLVLPAVLVFLIPQPVEAEVAE